jgi:histone acetyltransferase SAS3
MADAQLMEEELQQSAMQSERDAEQAHESVDGDVEMGSDSAFASQSHIDVGSGSMDGDGGEEMDYEEQRREYEDDEDHGDRSEQSEHDDDHSVSGGSEQEEDGEAFDEDAEGEDDDELVTRNHRPQRRSVSMANGHDDADDDEDEDEGVGAVKIRPGETDDEDGSSHDSASLASVSDADSEDEAEWEGAENDDADDDDDDESEHAVGHCIFCKQDEEHDPAEEFEVFLVCTKCGDNGQSPQPCSAV